jgi:cytidine deaminase
LRPVSQPGIVPGGSRGDCFHRHTVPSSFLNLGGKMSKKATSARLIEQLKAVARAASEHAYCPYSQFRVGAAVLSDKGEIFAGCNVENASYGLTICAERSAVFQMVAKAHTIIRAVAVYTPTETTTAPCGACRQVINEFGSDAEIICCCNGMEVLQIRLCELLPDAFGPQNLDGRRH